VFLRVRLASRPPLIGLRPLWCPSVAHDTPVRFAPFSSSCWSKPRSEWSHVARDRASSGELRCRRRCALPSRHRSTACRRRQPSMHGSAVQIHPAHQRTSQPSFAATTLQKQLLASSNHPYTPHQQKSLHSSPFLYV
jgi:hypothetical protein